MKKKILLPLIIISCSAFLLGAWYFFIPQKFSNPNSFDVLANVFGEQEAHHHEENITAQNFSDALEHKKFSFFAENIQPSQQRENFITSLQSFPLLMDITVQETEKFFFISYLSASSKNNTLKKNYSYWDIKSQEFFFNPLLTIKKISNTEFQNISPFPLFLSGEILGLPGDRILIPSKEKIFPQEKIFLTSPDTTEKISSPLKTIESIDFGFRVKVE